MIRSQFTWLKKFFYFVLEKLNPRYSSSQTPIILKLVNYVNIINTLYNYFLKITVSLPTLLNYEYPRYSCRIG